MSKEELLKPRYKVIADYPNIEWEVGEILDRDWGWDGDDESGFKHHISDYPHLFQPLEWWQERQPGEMPEYVKAKRSEQVLKVESIEYKYMSAILEDDNFPRSLANFLPATESEYQSFKQNQ
jgi:hypothetical protein